jgi:hypothetical protein
MDKIVSGYCICDCHTPIENLEQDVEIAKHNLWVAQTHVQDRKEELDKAERRLKKVKEINNIAV